MLRFDTGNEVLASTESTTLMVKGDAESTVVAAILEAVASEGDGFRKLAQVIVQHNFEVPALVCARIVGDTIHVFLFGDAAVESEPGLRISSAEATTWVEDTVDAAADLKVTWEAADATPSPPQPAVAESTGEAAQTNEDPAPQVAASEAAATPEPSLTPVPPGVPVASSPVAPSARKAPPRPPLPIPPLPTAPPAAASSSPEAPPSAQSESTDRTSTLPPVQPSTPEDDRRPDDTSIANDKTLDADEMRARLTPEIVTSHEDQGSPDTLNGPIVDSQICPCGAANRHGAPTCHSCGSSMDREGVRMGQAPRPSLGVLRFDDGQQHRLIGSVIIGRRPPTDHSVAGELYEAIPVDSPKRAVSKKHLEVRLIGWTVNAVDLESSNGTTVEEGTGRAPKRLRPNVVEQIASGTTIRFGDRSVVFEATAGI